MKKIVKICTILLSVMLLGGCSQSIVNQEEVTDTAIINELDEIAQENLKKYFNVEVDQTKSREKQVQRNVPKEEVADTIQETMVFTAKLESEPIEGELYSYGVMVNSETKAVTGLLKSVYSKADVQPYTDEEIEAIAQKFVREHELIASDKEVVLDKVTANASDKTMKMVTYKIGEKYLLIGVNLQEGQAVYFEYSL